MAVADQPISDPGMPAVIMGVAVTIYTLPNGQQIVCAPYDEFVADLKSVLAATERNSDE